MKCNLLSSKVILLHFSTAREMLLGTNKKVSNLRYKTDPQGNPRICHPY
jgi:hypothetical protein